MNIKERVIFFPRTYLTILATRGIKPSFTFIADFIHLKKDIGKKISAISKQYKIDNPGVAYQKYLDVDFWVYESLRRVYLLGLNKKTSSKKILDLGTGAGYFPYICKYYGHDAEALDVPDNEMYNQIIKELGIKRYTQYIYAYKDLDIAKKYDLITAFMICFNNHKSPGLWHIDQWTYFLKSVSEKNLVPGGKVFLSFNAETDEEPVSRELVSYFITKQAKVNGIEVSLEGNVFLNP
jgi:hypothetical protein